MTLAQALAHIAALEAQIDTQALVYKRQCLLISRLRRGRDYWRRMASVTEKQAAEPTWREKLIAEAEAIFKGAGE